MAKQMKQDTPLVPRKRRLAALIAATRCAGEKRDTLSCHARRCTTSSMAQGLTRRTPSADSPGTMCRGSVRSGLSGFLLQQGRRRDDGQYRLCHHAGIRPYRNDIHQPRQAAGNARHLYHPPPGLEERQ